ncbi:hypothetical protein CYMTET_22338 [Cymbomonas tetramitiformis]|uniref:G-patch domain-containing protein n=1 Tax=Cymbomonas tetramitiformis TaxID=36881 RepID=A0AAE0G0L3_9CHLO|nr:hypothetical protein CYMTET_22338 [Cymbomonas tetramitiformis]
MSTPEVQTLYQGVNKDDIGFKLISKMGWSEGKGLGTKEDGIASHIKVKKRREQTGIGADTKDHSKFNWTVNTVAFENVLEGLNSQFPAKVEPPSEGNKKKKGKKGKAKTSKDDEEVPEAKGSGKSKKDSEKKKKTGKGKKAAESDTEDSDDDDDDDDEPAPPAKKVLTQKGVRRGLPQGRYTRREVNKSVTGYSSIDLDAILGVVPTFTNIVVAPCSKPMTAASEPAEADEAEEKQGPTYEETLDPETRAKVAAFFHREDNWWGAKMFVSSGRLGDKQVKKKTEPEKVGFDEDDQERLYNATQGAATSGRAGLGIADRPKKVAGARWGGTKKKYDDDDDGSDEAEPEEAEAAEKMTPSASTPQKSDIKWKKLAEKAFAEAGSGKMKLKKLQKMVLASAKEKKAAGTFGDAALKAEFQERLQESSRFHVEDETVSLVEVTLALAP